MAGERTERALARIEAATRRIERASQEPAGLTDNDLERRYRDLWTQASAALADVDQLIGSLEP